MIFLAPRSPPAQTHGDCGAIAHLNNANYVLLHSPRGPVRNHLDGSEQMMADIATKGFPCSSFHNVFQRVEGRAEGGMFPRNAGEKGGMKAFTQTLPNL